MLVRARVEARGLRKAIAGESLVDTGAALTVLDRYTADELGVRRVNRRVKLIVMDGDEVEGELAILESLIVDGEELPGAHVALIDFHPKLKERLRTQGLSDWCVIGLSTLEILGLTPNTSKGVIERTGSFLL